MADTFSPKKEALTKLKNSSLLPVNLKRENLENKIIIGNQGPPERKEKKKKRSKEGTESSQLLTNATGSMIACNYVNFEETQIIHAKNQNLITNPES